MDDVLVGIAALLFIGWFVLIARVAEASLAIVLALLLLVAQLSHWLAGFLSTTAVRKHSTLDVGFAVTIDD